MSIDVLEEFLAGDSSFIDFIDGEEERGEVPQFRG